VSNNLSRNQKRKAKLAKRAKKDRYNGPTPYSGTKYQAPEWAPHLMATETAVYETIRLSKGMLTNDDVEDAFVHLIEHIRAGNPALLPEDAPEALYEPGAEVEYLVGAIRHYWRCLIEKTGPVRKDDLIGILRTLLNSVEAHAWNTGEDRGYVEFIKGHMERFMGLRQGMNVLYLIDRD
jgi:hypothetical protein